MKNDLQFAFAKDGILRKVVKNGKAVRVIQRGLFLCGSAKSNAAKMAEIICDRIYQKTK